MSVLACSRYCSERLCCFRSCPWRLRQKIHRSRRMRRSRLSFLGTRKPGAARGTQRCQDPTISNRNAGGQAGIITSTMGKVTSSWIQHLSWGHLGDFRGDLYRVSWWSWWHLGLWVFLAGLEPVEVARAHAACGGCFCFQASRGSRDLCCHLALFSACVQHAKHLR